jgi:hypothetical protein
VDLRHRSAAVSESQARTVAREMRLLAGFVVQPFFTGILGFIAFPLIDVTQRAIEGSTATEPMRGAISVALGAAFAAFFVTVCAAFPLVVWLLRHGPLTLKQVLLGGVMLGNLPFVVIMILAVLTNNVSSGASWLGLFRSLAFGALFGVAGAALFWAISIRGTAMAHDAAGSSRAAV